MTAPAWTQVSSSCSPNTAEGWEFLTVLPDDALAQLRELQRRGKLDEAAFVDLWNRYGHLLRGRQQPR
jgi:hypothetical protein